MDGFTTEKKHDNNLKRFWVALIVKWDWMLLTVPQDGTSSMKARPRVVEEAKQERRQTQGL